MFQLLFVVSTLSAVAFATSEFPYVVSVEQVDTHFCGGVLIKDSVVLTTASCVNGLRPHELQVRAGHELISQKGAQVSQVTSYTLHPDYDPFEVSNDVALLQLTTKFVLGESVKTINLPSATADYHGKTALLLGWRSFTESSSINPVQTLLIDDETCARNIDADVPESSICGFDGPSQKEGACSGNYGAPLVIHDRANPSNDLLIGLDSWVMMDRERNCLTTHPTVFVNLPKVVDFIKEEMTYL